MNMRRTRVLWMAVALLLAMGPMATWLGSSAAAQAGNRLSGTVFDPDGKPYANVTLVFTSEETHRVFTVTTDAKGRYITGDMEDGIWDIDVKDQTGAVVFKAGVKVGGGQTFTQDIKVVVSEQQKQQQAEQKKFQGMKANFDAGAAAYTQGVAIQKQLAQATADQKDALQAQLTQLAESAIADFQAALATLAATDTNRHIILYRIAQSYELEGKDDQAVAFYQQTIASFPPSTGPNGDLAGSYNNLGNALAREGKIDDALAAYQKAADADPPQRSFGLAECGGHALQRGQNGGRHRAVPEGRGD